MTELPSRGLTQVPLSDRALLRIAGEDARSFLQGLITNDVQKVTEASGIYAGLLTPQGKFLFDFFLVPDGDGLLLDCEAARAEILLKRLTMYRLRAKATLEDISADHRVWAVFGADAPAAIGQDGPMERGQVRTQDGRTVMADPRHEAMGLRIIVKGQDRPLPDHPETGLEDYARHRIALGVPQGGIDILPDKSFLLESNFEELGGVDFKKGCYIGQELTARTKHRSGTRKRILPLDLDGAVPEPGTPVTADTREIGTVTSGVATGTGARALALIRLDRLADAQEAGHGLTIAGAPASLDVPDWLKI